MTITKDTLAGFRRWLLARGRTEGTANLYCSNLRMCAADEVLTARLVSGKLAPLTLRTNKAALKAWARYQKDVELDAIVSEIKLPPARRRGIKQPLEVEHWRQVADHLGEMPMTPTLRAVCLVIVKRGLRVSDALRIRRAEVKQALKTGVLSYLGKGSKRHEASAAPLRAELEVLADAEGWETLADLVTRQKRGKSAVRRIERVFEKAGKKLKLENVHPHRFRRTYATAYLEEHKGDPRAIIKLQHHMGWASMQTAALYADAVDHEQLAHAGDKLAERVFGK